MELFLAFPDGVFDYACATCTALCCKAQGTSGSLTGEMQRLFTLYPASERLVKQRTGDVVHLASLDGRCYFLDENRCRIEVEHGKDHKPTLCNVFPFSRLRLDDDLLTVTPHFLCPLSIHAPVRPDAVEGTHARIADAVRTSGLLDPVALRSAVPSLPIFEPGPSHLAREQRFRDACTQALGRATFASVLDERDRSRKAAVAALPMTAPPRDDLDDVLLAIAPSLRVPLWHLPPDVIDDVLALFAAYVRTFSGTHFTPSGAAELFDQIGPALRLVARGDLDVDLRDARTSIPAFGAPALTFAAYRIVSAAGPLLPRLEAELPTIATLADRMALLVALGAIVDGLEMRASRARRNAR